jgi:hypothetical protein
VKSLQVIDLYQVFDQSTKGFLMFESDDLTEKSNDILGFCLRFEGVAIEKEIGNILFAVFAATHAAFLASDL